MGRGWKGRGEGGEGWGRRLVKAPGVGVRRGGGRGCMGGN